MFDTGSECGKVSLKSSEELNQRDTEMNKYALIEYYNSLENKEINQLVAEAEGMNCVHERDGFICYQMNHGGSMKFDPCNTPNDAFPIMLKYEIAISPYSLSKDLPYYDKYKDMWFAMKDKDWYIDDKNPLRAAMIIFLMMKEAEKESVEAQETP